MYSPFFSITMGDHLCNSVVQRAYFCLGLSFNFISRSVQKKVSKQHLTLHILTISHQHGTDFEHYFSSTEAQRPYLALSNKTTTDHASIISFQSKIETQILRYTLLLKDSHEQSPKISVHTEVPQSIDSSTNCSF